MARAADADLTFRPARRDDLAVILRLLVDDALGAAREQLADPLPACYADAFDEIEADPNNEIFVAARGGRVIGVMQLTYIRSLTYEGGRRAQVEGVRVDATARGEGVGEAFMRWAIDRARRRGCHLVQLTTNRQRARAHRFYERLGFVDSHCGMKLHFSGRDARRSVPEPTP